MGISSLEWTRCDFLSLQSTSSINHHVLQINRIISIPSPASPIKLVFLCSPGNPTGTLIPLASVRAVLSNPNYDGLVIVDEAYIDFGEDKDSAIRLLVNEGWKNLVILQTLSKGFGLAAIRQVFRALTTSP